MRQKRLSRIAARNGYRFIAKDTSNVAPFFENFIPANPYRSYEVGEAVNIIQGEIEGTEFSYFEQSLSLATGVFLGSGKDDRHTSSVIALNISGYNDFEIRLLLNQELSMKKIGEWIYFWRDDRKVIPVRKFEQLLMEVVDSVKRGLGKTALQ